MFALSNLAGAVSLCASTAQEFQDDLANASDGGMFSGESVEINLVQGTYTVGATTANGPFTYTSAWMAHSPDRARGARFLPRLSH